ncbi:MAG TPA: KH domain-containing protein [Chloroflexota bacterium]|nr:KH domain-containing protein [Chloroflexota bacterium]
MRELIEFVAQNLVSKPDEVKVEEVESGRQTVVELTVARSDVGKVIGKQGRTARALRSILKVAAAKQGKRASLEIL